MRRNRHQHNGFNITLFLFLCLILGLVLLFLYQPAQPTLKKILIPLPTSTPEVSKIPNTPFVSAYGTDLYLNGQPFKFTGVNAYSLASVNNTNAGCGGEMSGIDDFFSSLRPNSVVRMWAFQGSMATNIRTKKLDWGPLDKTVRIAEDNNQKLILVLAGQAGTCDDGHWKDKDWYAGGFKQAFNDNQSDLTPLPYLDYVRQIVNRYKNSKTIAMWELVSEPESSNCAEGFTGDDCYGHQSCTNEPASTQALRSFFDEVGKVVKGIDKNHIIESGVIGGGQCGAIFEDYSYIHESPFMDVASYHDYGSDSVAIPGDQWNGLQKRLNQMKDVNKPLIIGEVGMLAHPSAECMTLEDRVSKMKAKMDAQFSGGIVGFLPWDYTGGQSPICNYDFGDKDPLMNLMHDFPLI